MIRIDTTTNGHVRAPMPLSASASRVRARSLRSDLRADYYEFIPSRIDRGAPLLVAVHGISLNAREHAELFAAQAERLGVPVVAPVFHPDTFQGFQRPEGR